MKKLSLQLTLAISIFSFFLIGCAVPEPPNSAANQTTNASQPSNANVAASMKMVAYHFEKKLEPYEGKLISLQVNDGNIDAEWESKKCGSLKSEVIDLAISLNRGYNEFIKNINMRRTCDSNTRSVSISGEKYYQYRSAKIGDQQFTGGIE
jgi:hypothetical protein